MALELEGRIARKLNVQSGTSARGAWHNQEFIFEYQEGNFPSQICMNVWGDDKVKELEKYQVGDRVKILSTDFEGVVSYISEDKKKVRVTVSMFGRQTPIDVEATDVEKISY